MTQGTALKATPLLDLHKELKGKLVPFAGWQMPIQYRGVIEEHRCVRSRAGLFDVSHMGELDIRGPGARDFLQYLVTNDLDTLADGSVLYTVMCYEHGGVVDDLLIHRYAPDHYFACINASNTDKDFEWAAQQARRFDVKVENISSRIAQFALQGPLAETVLQPLAEVPLEGLKYYHFTQGRVCGVGCVIARTGYTGEDGFELYLDAQNAVPVFRELLAAGAPHGLEPCGLGARDTLRLEMGYALYGHEISAEVHPLEARLGWVVRFDKEGDFIGKAALQRLKAEGLKRRLVGLKMLARGVPRAGYRILKEGRAVGEVTSGTFSPTLRQGVALGFVPAANARAGERYNVAIRNQSVAAEVTALPFVPSHVKK